MQSFNKQIPIVKNFPEDLILKEEDYLSEEDFKKALATRIDYMLQYKKEVFFQWLYKIDVYESKLKIAMKEVDASYAIASLILERQIEKMKIQDLFPKGKNQIDDNLAW